MKPAILLIGNNGQVGRELNRILPHIGEVTSLDRQQLDLSKPEEIRRAIRAFRPAWIVNAAAYTAVDKAESEESAARAINADAPALMAEEAKKIGAFLVHYSTDYVFDGLKTTPYDENDRANPQSVYGRTKLDGERAIEASGVPHLIVRTAWVYATQGRNFLLTILRLAAEKEELRVVRDQIGAPTWNLEIASATGTILRRLCAEGPESVSTFSGIYHMTAAGETSWHEFARAILEEASSARHDIPWIIRATGNKPFIARRVIGITTGEYPTPAQRPPYSVLSNARLMRTFGIALPDWRTALHSAFEDTEKSFGA
jgi:dTDP-4-dehydrorhamnose reductase